MYFLVPCFSPVAQGMTHKELHDLAERIEPQSYRKIGLGLGFQEAALSQYRCDKRDSIRDATYAMLSDWLKDVTESESRGRLVQALESCGLKQLSESVASGAEPSGMKFRGRKDNKMRDGTCLD